MADYNINAVTRRVVYTGSAGTGPYSFTFEILDQNDVAVYFNSTLLTITTDYTVTINANGTGSITIVTGSSVPSTPDGDDSITIVGARDIERTTDFVTAGDLLAASLNEQLDALTIFDQQISERVDRGLLAPVTDPTTIDMTLPSKADRLGKYLAFNATTGNPEAGPSTTDVTTLAAVTSDIATLADIEDGTDATDAIQTVAGISGNVTTVAGISANVTTVAGNTSNINAVAADAADIGTVAGISSDVTTVAGISSDVTTVAADGTDIGTVAGISANVTTVAGISSDVTTVAGISGDVSSVAAQVIGYDFSTTTAMADPGSGNVRFNNATVASVTAIAIDDLDKNGVDQSAYIALFDDSTNTVKGTLVFRTGGGDVATFNITGLTDNTGWFQIAVTHVASSGTFADGEDTFIGFTRAGDKGADGAGSGDVSGPGSATDNAVVRWDGTSGQLVQNSGVTINDSGDLAANNFSGTHSGTSSGTNTGDQTITLTGDVTGSGTGSFAATIANDAVTLAKMASGTAGNLITYDASGDPAAVATGTAAQVLTSNGAGAAPTFQDAAASGWEFVETITASAASTVDFETSIVSGYDYQVVIDGVTLSANVQFAMQYGTGGTPTYQTTAYRWQTIGGNGTTAQAARATSDSDINLFGTGYSTGSDPAVSGLVTILDPGATSDTRCQYSISAQASTTTDSMACTFGFGDRDAAEVVTAFRFKADSGTLTGEFRLYRKAVS